MSAPFTRIGKQILANGFHYADGADETAAQFILDKLNGSGWQPIETASRTFGPDVHVDDQAIQLWAENIWGVTRWTFGFWTNGEGTADQDKGWWDAAERAFCLPTHWMPVPTPPVEG